MAVVPWRERPVEEQLAELARVRSLLASSRPRVAVDEPVEAPEPERPAPGRWQLFKAFLRGRL